MSDNSFLPDLEPHDIVAAASLLTRLPVPVDHERAGERAASAVWAYPIVGAVVGLICGLISMTLVWVDVPSGIAAAVCLGLSMLVTGALHEDGLSDCADGLGGAYSKDRALEIMKDSRIGAFGAAALIAVLLARWSGTDWTLNHLTLWAFAGFGAASRLPMVLAMFAMPLARSNGLAAGVGRPQAVHALVALALTAVICFVAFGFTALPVLFWSVAAALPLYLLAMRRIGGYTGDVLGGSQQLSEVAAMATALAILA